MHNILISSIYLMPLRVKLYAYSNENCKLQPTQKCVSISLDLLFGSTCQSVDETRLENHKLEHLLLRLSFHS